MKKLIFPLFLIVSLSLAACSPQTVTPTATTEIPLPALTTAAVTPEATSTTEQTYNQHGFWLEFHLPAGLVRPGGVRFWRQPARGGRVG